MKHGTPSQANRGPKNPSRSPPFDSDSPRKWSDFLIASIK
jgi:hypothetical protein